MCVELIDRYFDRRVAYDERGDLLAPHLRGSSDNGNLTHAGVLDDDVLHFARVDVGTAGDDEILRAINDV